LIFSVPVINMATMRRGLSLFLLHLLVFATLATSFHQHADGGYHSDCPICITVKHQPATAPDAQVTAVAREFAATTFVPPVLISLPGHTFSPAQSRAPPR
jgi:hypothetical protein